MAGKANFSIIRGDTFLRNCTFRNKTSNTPINLTGATITGKIGSASLTCNITSAVNGQFSFGLTALQTAALPVGVTVIEVQVTYADLTVQTLFTGNVNVMEQNV